jgi:hypothetical protein
MDERTVTTMADRNVVFKDREYVVRYTVSENGEPSMMIVRPLVRCKDCGHKLSCNRLITPSGRRDNDFCSCGDRW